MLNAVLLGVAMNMPIGLVEDAAFPMTKPEAVGLSSQSLERLMAHVKRWVEDDEAVGAEVLLIKNRKTVLHEAVGFKDRERGVALEPGTICCIRSMSKPLTGTAIQMLIEAGKL